MKKRNEVIEFLSVIYQSDSSSINIIISDDNIWATQKAISELFDCAVNNIAYHIKEIINSKELDEILDAGRDAASRVGYRKIAKVYQKIGLGRKQK